MDRQSTTVARYIQRFREAKPLSPGHRRRQRAILEEDFWWMRSYDFGESKANNNGSPSGVGRGVLPSFEIPAQDPEGGASPNTFLVKDVSAQMSMREPARRIGSAEEVIPSRDSYVGEICEIVSVDSFEDQDSSSPLGETSFTVVSSKPGSPGPPCPNDGEAESKPTQSPLDRPQEHFVADVSSSWPGGCEESEELGYLDARASAVLECCRRLLATSSTSSAQVDENAPKENGMMFPKERDDVFNKRTTGFLDHSHESLEQRTRMLCHEDRQNLDIGLLSRLYKNMSLKELNERGDVGTRKCNLAPHEEVDIELALCMMPASRHSDERPALRGHAKHGEGDASLDLPSFLSDVERLSGHSGSYTSKKETRGLNGSRTFVSNEEHEPNSLGAARSKYIAGGINSGSPRAFGCHVQSSTSEGIDSCDLPQPTCILGVSGTSPPGADMSSTRSSSQTGEPSKTNLLVRRPGGITLKGDFSEDAVVTALTRRVDQVEAELERRRSLASV